MLIFWADFADKSYSLLCIYLFSSSNITGLLVSKDWMVVSGTNYNIRYISEPVEGYRIRQSSHVYNFCQNQHSSYT